MKKFFEKYDLIKISGILVLLTVLLTWLIPYGYFSGTELVTDEITRVGLTDFMQYGLLGIYYFPVLVTFLFVLGGFYQVLSKTAGYQSLIKSISEKLKGREVAFVLIVSLLLAVLCSLTNEYLPILVLIPFIITILNRLKVDKISAFCTTYGALLVGTIGSTCSSKVVGYINSSFGTEVGNFLTLKVIILLVVYILLNVFTVLRMKKTLKDKKFKEYDKFEIDSVASEKEKPKVWPYVVGLILMVLVVVLAYLPWSSWEITLFDDVTEWVNELSLFGFPIFSTIFSTFKAFGSWDLFTIQFVLLFATLLIHWFGRVSWSEIFTSFGEGFKKMSYVAIVLLIVYLVLEFAVMYPVVPVIINWISSLAKSFNAFFAFVSAFITSIFGVEMQYVMNLAGTYFAATYEANTSVLAIIFQLAFGFASFFVPSSAILMVGLAYLDIPYKDWMKYIWKFLLALLVVIAVIILVICI